MKIGDPAFQLAMKDPATRRAWLAAAVDEIERRLRRGTVAPETREGLRAALAAYRANVKPDGYDPIREGGER